MGYFIFLLYRNFQIQQCRVFGKKMEMRIFNSRRYEGVKEWKKLHNKEFYEFYTTPSFVRWM